MNLIPSSGKSRQGVLAVASRAAHWCYLTAIVGTVQFCSLPGQQKESTEGEKHPALYDRFFEESQTIVLPSLESVQRLRSYNDLLDVGIAALPYLRAKRELNAPAAGLPLLIEQIEFGARGASGKQSLRRLPDNLLSDGSFEQIGKTPKSGEQAWKIRSDPAGVVMDEAMAIHGQVALKMFSPDRRSAVIVQSFPAAPGKLYSFSVYTRWSSGSKGRFSIRFTWQPSDKLNNKVFDFPATRPGAWFHTQCSAEAPADSAEGILELLYLDQGNSQDAIFCDFARLYEER